MQLSKQAQSPRKSGAECPLAILDEGTLEGTFTMAAASEKAFHIEGRLEERILDTTVKMAAHRDCIEEVIIISDEETERQYSHRVERKEENLQSAGLPGEMANRSVRRMPSLDGSLCHEVRAESFGSQSVFKGASARFESPDKEWLDYEEDVEEQVIPAQKSVVRETTHSVPKVVRGDCFGNHHRDVAVANLPRVSQKGGVDVSIQVHSDSETGAGKSEVGLDTASGVVPKDDEAIEDKVQQLISMLEEAVKKTKLELRQAQALLGHLDFACKVVRVGRAFCRRLGFAMRGAILLHHHIRLKAHIREDLKMWIGFLQEFNGVSMLVEDSEWFWQIQIFSDVPGANGFGLFLDGHWAAEAWPAGWEKANHSIAFLEFFPLVVALVVWGPYLANRNVVFNVDNQTVVSLVNSQKAKDVRVLKLLQIFPLHCLKVNVMFKAR
ncbi:hypothetical protein NDU88_008435 [Pleurodeles waltl]|uniref:RNase H type-1 domain-containing protein n=1 Tax=Pleurodeles waltl TaxID=8319 RepID=A0AAV7RSC2_PLEWA|nr:hypothetical protein NDU88_008435 [Pleurodeles waltl]